MHMHEFVHDLGDRFAIGRVVLEDLRRPAIQPVSQFLDGLHVARFAARDMHSCDLAQFFSCPRRPRRVPCVGPRDKAYRAVGHAGVYSDASFGIASFGMLSF